jgi:uncharacterized protein (DUF1499 family)
MPLLRNWFDTDEAGADSGPLDLPISVSEALARLETAIKSMSRWHLESHDASTGIVTATRKTRLFRFTDDVTLRLEATPSGTRIHAVSRSRVGASDLGQNRRNVKELFTKLMQT